MDGDVEGPVGLVVPGGAEDVGAVIEWLGPGGGLVGPLFGRRGFRNELLGPRNRWASGLAPPRLGGAS